MSVSRPLQLIQFRQKIRKKQSSHNKVLILLQDNIDIILNYEIKARVPWHAQMERKHFAQCCFSQWIRQYFSREARAVGQPKIDKGLLALPFQRKDSTSLCWFITFFDLHKKLWCLNVCFACLQIHYLLAYIKTIIHSSRPDFQAGIFLVLKKKISSYLKLHVYFLLFLAGIQSPCLSSATLFCSGESSNGSPQSR